MGVFKSIKLLAAIGIAVTITTAQYVIDFTNCERENQNDISCIIVSYRGNEIWRQLSQHPQPAIEHIKQHANGADIEIETIATNPGNIIWNDVHYDISGNGWGNVTFTGVSQTLGSISNNSPTTVTIRNLTLNNVINEREGTISIINSKISGEAWTRATATVSIGANGTLNIIDSEISGGHWYAVSIGSGGKATIIDSEITATAETGGMAINIEDDVVLDISGSKIISESISIGGMFTQTGAEITIVDSEIMSKLLPIRAGKDGVLNITGSKVFSEEGKAIIGGNKVTIVDSEISSPLSVLLVSDDGMLEISNSKISSSSEDEWTIIVSSGTVATISNSEITGTVGALWVGANGTLDITESKIFSETEIALTIGSGTEATIVDSEIWSNAPNDESWGSPLYCVIDNSGILEIVESDIRAQNTTAIINRSGAQLTIDDSYVWTMAEEGNFHAIDNRATLNIIDSDIWAQNTTPIHNGSSSQMTITNGRIWINEEDSEAPTIISSGHITLGGSPFIEGTIRTAANRPLIANETFNPADSNFYSIFIEWWETNNTDIVLGAGEFIENFELEIPNPNNVRCSLVVAGDDIVLRRLYRLNFNLAGGTSETPPEAVEIPWNFTVPVELNPFNAEEIKKIGFMSDGDWFFGSLNIFTGEWIKTGDFVFGEEGTVITQNNTINLEWEAAPVKITTPWLSYGILGTVYSTTMGNRMTAETERNVGGDIVFDAITPLPDGLSLDRETGIISGGPTKAGTFPFTVKATNLASMAYAEREFSIRVFTSSNAIPNEIPCQRFLAELQSKVTSLCQIPGILDLYLRNMGITDLQGIQLLTGLMRLDVSNDDEVSPLRSSSENRIKSIDLSQNTQLVELNLRGNELKELDVTGLPNLAILDVRENFMLSENSVKGLDRSITTDFKFAPQRDPGSVSIIVPTESNRRYGIRFAVNPVSDKAEISVVLPNNERASEMKIVVYDMTGNVVHSGASTASTGSATGLSWDLRNSAGRFVANGTYLVIVEVKSATGKIYAYSARLGVKR